MNFNSPSIEHKMRSLVEDGERYLDEQNQIENTWGSDRETWPAGQRERWDRLATAIKRNVTEVESLEAYIERVEKALSNPKNLENGFGGMPTETPTRRSDPWRSGGGDDLIRMDTPAGLKQRAQDAVEYAQGLPVHARETLAEVVDREGHIPSASALIVALTSDHYARAFEKFLHDPVAGHRAWTPAEQEAYARVQSVRATMSLTDANGGYLAPMHLDPAIVLTNTGSINPLRAVARKVTTTQNDWNGVTSDGIQSEWLAENAEAANASPGFERITATTHKLAAVAAASWELIQDTNIGAQVTALIGDSFSRAENVAFTNGNGTTAPLGITTKIKATTASQVSPTTGGTFGLDDVYKLDEALWPRARAGRPVWLMARSTQNLVRRFSEETNGSSLWADGLGGGAPPRLLGAEAYEASELDAAVTTGSLIAVLGDAQAFIIADRIGTSIAYNPYGVGDNARPTFTGWWMAHRRVGTTVSNDDSWVGLLL